MIFSNRVMAREPHAGKILRSKGSVVIVREGKSIDARAEAKIFQTDEIKTGEDSLVELLLLDGSSLHLGPASSLSLHEYRFNLTGEKKSFICRVTKGIFVYISGAISKLRPGAVKFETPDGTVAIRGTKLVIRIIAKDPVSGTSGETTVVLFKDPGGRIGKVMISNQHGERTLTLENQAVTVSWDQVPSLPVIMERKDLELLIPEDLYPIIFENYSPPLGYSEAFESWLEGQKVTFEIQVVNVPVSSFVP